MCLIVSDMKETEELFKLKKRLEADLQAVNRALALLEERGSDSSGRGYAALLFQPQPVRVSWNISINLWKCFQEKNLSTRMWRRPSNRLRLIVRSSEIRLLVCCGRLQKRGGLRQCGHRAEEGQLCTRLIRSVCGLRWFDFPT